jgi:hypothetical protein
MEAFSDGVIAIVITIMVLEMKIPHGGEFSRPRSPNSSIYQLCPEFRLCGHLLEQPSSYATYSPTRKRDYSLG